MIKRTIKCRAPRQSGLLSYSMIAIIKTNNPVTLSFAQAVLRDSNIEFFTADTHVSVLEGSIGVIPRRLMVLEDDVDDAQKALVANGLGKELQPV